MPRSAGFSDWLSTHQRSPSNGRRDSNSLRHCASLCCAIDIGLLLGTSDEIIDHDRKPWLTDRCFVTADLGGCSRTKTFQGIFDPLSYWMKGQSQDSSQERARETVAHAELINKNIGDERFDGCIGEKEQSHGHAVNESFANNESGADGAGVKHRHASAEHQAD